MHNAYKCGKWWNAVKGYEYRQNYHICDSEESLSHILTEYQASGQKIVWELAEELWALKSLP